jgi:hypothetical protein
LPRRRAGAEEVHLHPRCASIGLGEGDQHNERTCVVAGGVGPRMDLARLISAPRGCRYRSARAGCMHARASYFWYC